jgi:hypothetical protein
MSRIKCDICNKKYGCKKILFHVPLCIIEKNINKSGYLIEFLYNKTDINYYIYIIFDLKSTFNDILLILHNYFKLSNKSISNIYIDKHSNLLNVNDPISIYKKNIKFIYQNIELNTIIYFKIIKKLNGYENINNIEIVYKYFI